MISGISLIYLFLKFYVYDAIDLQAITDQAEGITEKEKAKSAVTDKALAAEVQEHRNALIDSNIVAAMKSIVGQFNDKAVSSKNYEDFLKDA